MHSFDLITAQVVVRFYSGLRGGVKMGYDPQYRKKSRSIAYQKAEKVIKHLNDSYKSAVGENEGHIYTSDFTRQIEVEGCRGVNALAGIYTKGGRAFYYFGERVTGRKPIVRTCGEWELKELIYCFLHPWDKG
ncbi:MAG: hypothetical protein GY738_24300 [Pseudoalteromonas sp.]|nr:hypothetical protein [Pseudoalteromonas sp.]